MNVLKVAVIGCGNISVMHLDSIVALEQSELVAACDTKQDRANAAAQKYNAKAYTDNKEMFEKEDLDVVHLCLPHYLHTIVARDAFYAGIHVLSGKPYWGSQHAVQINQFYNSLNGLEELEISGKEALKIQKIVCDIYKNNDCKI